jgi:hypothetical protein
MMRLAAGLVLLGLGCARPLGERFLTPSRGDWRRGGPVRHFTADNLYDCINGEAPFVISFGFRSLAQATYRRGAEAETTVDIYDLGSASNAFALFRNRANLDAQPLDLGREGAGDDARIEFWQGRFYVVLSLSSPGERPSVLALARRFSEALPPASEWPEYLDLLPTAGRVARSEQYLPTNFFGQEFLRRAVSARYKAGDREVLLFACHCDSAAEAAATLARFEAVLRKPRPVEPLAVGEGGFLAEEPTLGRLAVFRRGPFLGGVTRYANEPAIATLLADLERLLAARSAK